jgi:hypothetical protein
LFTVNPITHEKEEDPRIVEFRKKIETDYEGVVLGSEIPQDPPKRGPYGEAYIPLIESFVPTRTRPFQMFAEKGEAHKKIAQDWIDRHFIEKPPTGTVVEWLSPSLTVPKKNPEFPWRGVVDMRGPNSQTRRVSYPLPIVEDLLVKQGANQIFYSLDLRKAFYQQPMEEKSRPITCCFTPLGTNQWRVNVMGLKNASQQFKQMMEDRLSPVRHCTDPFIDYIIMGTHVLPGQDLLEAHDRDLRRIMDVLKQNQFICDPRKCHFFVDEVEFCGHILCGGTRRPAPGKLKCVEKWALPQTVSEMRAFLGFTNYYSVYIHKYAEIVAPLQDKLKVPRAEGKKGSKKKITWSESDIQAFEDI